MRHGFNVDVNGKMHNTNQSQTKFWSDIYFAPTFDLKSVPRQIKRGKAGIDEIIANTSVSQPR
jgi:hypothetical protein